MYCLLSYFLVFSFVWSFVSTSLVISASLVSYSRILVLYVVIPIFDVCVLYIGLLSSVLSLVSDLVSCQRLWLCLCISLVI